MSVLRTHPVVLAWSLSFKASRSISFPKTALQPLLYFSWPVNSVSLQSVKSFSRSSTFSRLPNRLNYASIHESSNVSPSPRLNVWVGLSCSVIYEGDGRESLSKPSDLLVIPTSRQRMRAYVQFLTTPTADTPGTSLLLHFDNKRYLIGNIHEGTQRSILQRGKKLNKVSDIFLTGKTEWKNTGGLIGIILSLADTIKTATASVAAELAAKAANKRKHQSLQVLRGKDKSGDGGPKAESGKGLEAEKQTLKIHGGANLTHTIATARRFVFRKGMPVDIDEINDNRNGDWEPTWKDENIRVWAMSILPGAGEGVVAASTPQHTRKRSFDDYIEDMPKSAASTSASQGDSITTSEQAHRDQQLRRGVVSHMFDSDWRLDALIETPIAQVRMPAALFIRNPETKEVEKYSGPMPGGDISLPDINVLVRKPWPGALITQLPPTKPSVAALSYIIRNYPQRGKFLPKKALDLKVPRGRLFSELAAGQPVQSSEGKTVFPEQVLEEGTVGGGFAVVDLPSTDYVENLLSREEWCTEKVMEGVEAIVWILGPNVVLDKRLQKFMSELSHVKHVISSTDCCSNYLSLDSSAAATIRLNQIDPERHPVPVHNNRSSPLREGLLSKESEISKCIVANRGLTIDLAPTMRLLRDESVPPLNTAYVLYQTPKNVLFLSRAIRQEIVSPEIQKELRNQDLPSPDAEIIPLGTGSALPSKYRNVSATLLRVPGSGSYLLDCGENTLGQLSRVFSQDELIEVLCDLKMIWISHMHADHHLGTVSVIKAWYKAVYGADYRPDGASRVPLMEQLDDPAKAMMEEKRLFVISSDAMAQWLQEYSSVEDYGYDKIIALNVWGAKPGKPNTTLMQWNGVTVGFDTASAKLNEAMRTATGFTSFAAANVPHCYGAKGVSLTFPTGFKFTYSGDCRPCRALVEIGQGSTVLLHEATFDDDLRGDAQAKLHSTTSEAIGVGIAMGARRVLLTHFSQRYQKIPVMDAVEGQELVLETAEDETPGNLVALVDAGELPAKAMAKPISEMVEDESGCGEILPTKPERRRSSGASGGASGKASSGMVEIRKVGSLKQKPRTDMKVGVAFDYMRVKVKDIAILERFTPALLKLYDRPELDDNVGKVRAREKEKEETVGSGKREGSREKSTRGGNMGKVKRSESQRRQMRDGTRLFDQQEATRPRRMSSAEAV